MPRPISWLPRLHLIRQSVENSVRSHYTRRELEQLFELQPRAAQKLLELLPTVPVGSAHLVEREALLAFLEGVQDAEDVPGYMERLRTKPAPPVRRKLRSLVRADLPPVDLTSLPLNLTLEPGRLEVRFGTLEELAEAMLTVARLLEGDGERFAKLYEPRAEVPEAGESADLRTMWEELEEMEATKRDLQPRRDYGLRH